MHRQIATGRGVLGLSSSISAGVWIPVPVATLFRYKRHLLKEVKNTVSRLQSEYNDFSEKSLTL
ncbi:hypothetical protein ACQKMI_16445 [Lysinibacillus sp. NPDC097214]|uniref:hypothetical protein n=1 Tax=Lysinibacillus sp. NPDC097214 TaxID=3390584 RepID=UPI003CFBD843